MTHIIKKQASPYTAEQMFDLVVDFNNYPRFLPFCSKASSRIINANEILGTLYINKGPFQKSFTTHNTMFNKEKIIIELVDGPFKKLEGNWQFINLSNGSEIILDLNYEVKNGLLQNALSAVFELIAKSMVECFCKEANKIYSLKTISNSQQ